MNLRKYDSNNHFFTHPHCLRRPHAQARWQHAPGRYLGLHDLFVSKIRDLFVSKICLTYIITCYVKVLLIAIIVLFIIYIAPEGHAVAI